jgi:hypothetical protein
MNGTASRRGGLGVLTPVLASTPSSGSPPPCTGVNRADGLRSAPATDTPEALRHLARLMGQQAARRLYRGFGCSEWLAGFLLLLVALVVAAVLAVGPRLIGR